MPLHNGGIAFGGGSGGGGGFPPNDLTTFTSESTESGVKLNFSGPEPTYIPDSDGAAVFAAAPRGVMIRYSTEGYPLTEKDGVLGYDFNPEGEDWNGTETNTYTVIGLTKDTKYYFTAFPYSDYGVFNRSESTKNRTEMTWVGNKGTISVNVQTPAGYTGTLGEYTITLVDQATESPQNIEQSFSGVGIKQIGNLDGGKTYKVRLGTPEATDLKAPADSEAITIIAGANNSVTLAYEYKYGTANISVSTSPANMPVGEYTLTLTPQAGGSAITRQGNGAQTFVISNIDPGTYTVGLTAKNHYTANVNGNLTVVGGGSVSHNVSYAFSASFNESTWAEINAISASGQAASFYNLGDIKQNVTVKKYRVYGGVDTPATGTLLGTGTYNVLLYNIERTGRLLICTMGCPLQVSGGWETSEYEDDPNKLWIYGGDEINLFLKGKASEIMPEVYPYVKENTGLRYTFCSLGFAGSGNWYAESYFAIPSERAVTSGYFTSNDRRKLNQNSKYMLGDTFNDNDGSLIVRTVWRSVVSSNGSVLGDLDSQSSQNIQYPNTSTSIDAPIFFAI